MHLYLIRHGQSFVNLKEWTGGNQDTGLTELGHRQAAALGAWMPGEVPKIDALYASSMLRARETADYLALAYGVDRISDDRLREIGNNRADHQPWPGEDLPEYGDFWGSERPFASVTPSREGGESLTHPVFFASLRVPPFSVPPSSESVPSVSSVVSACAGIDTCFSSPRIQTRL